MLILKRKVMETLCIGDDVKVTVLSIEGNIVRIGIEAPREIPVHRQEIFGRTDEEAAERQLSASPFDKSHTKAIKEAYKRCGISDGTLYLG